ncbi:MULTISPECIES: RagB/SusD family nutrient uptake outer membrane protein [unclassified Flavobacterium]|uniref:RagB/SusD family nutrient uptake outer membrane protein n=1 Tax=unclassified Flavobacterium TaxID=196869 RepID=UPI000F0C9A8A|nr:MULTISPECIES: RagB/SusD family nutrient uptake outer membrane protein [unclassified Flavobacterium]AYN04015.1 RagB/SusD family nutrient uptake outer membrane protein [Flavobacterium sp. 140616W15]MCD0476490.1 RagB/SusD family nutrient uptake outer membrane protein [Flavobacterium sp. EDS]
MKNISKYLFLFVAAIVASSCDDYLDVKPVGKVIPETLTDFRAVLTRGYAVFPLHKSLTALRTDEMILEEESNDYAFYKDNYIWNDANPDLIATKFPYGALYNCIFYANVIINEANNKLEASPEKDQLIGEAYALRAFAYFDLVNLFAKQYDATTANSERGVPLALEIDLEQVFKPESVAIIYGQIISDKEAAKKLLNKDTQATGLNYRFSKAALYALESRVYLYQKQWAQALQAADKGLAINNALVDLNATPILPNNYDTKESIMALENTFENKLKRSAYPAPSLINTYDQANDLRFNVYYKASGNGFIFLKGGEIYQKNTFRTSELYLTKAEASAQLNDLATARTTTLIFIKNRYNTTGFAQLSTKISAMNQTELLDFIYQERQREFAIEGQRWFDLRRTTQKQIVHTLSGKTYTLIQNDPRYTLPFPLDARLNNPEL